MKWLTRLSIALFIVVNIFIFVEIVLRLILPTVPEAFLDTEGKLYVEHPRFIFEHVKSQNVVESKKVGDIEVYNKVHYDFDEYGRRITWQGDPSLVKSSAIFMGSSVIFGKGIEGGFTIPSYFAKANKNWEVFNYSVQGWGTQQYLEVLRTRELQKEVNHPLKMLVFFISVNRETGHVQRLQGSMDLCTPCWWMENLPVYRKNSKSQSFEFKGTFDKYMPVRFYAYKFLQNLMIVRYFRINVSKMEQSDYDTYVDLLKEIYELAHEKYPQAKVFFVNHPFSDLESTKLLVNSKGYGSLPMLDYSLLIPKSDLPQYYFGVQWPYPRPELNQRIATELGRDLLSQEKN